MFKKNEHIEVADFEKEMKKRERKAEWNRKKTEAWDWVCDNKELIMLFGPTLIGGVTASVKAVNKHVKLNKEKNLKELYCWDPSLGHHWKLRREITNSEWVEIDKRKRNGERLGDILNEFKVLK